MGELTLMEMIKYAISTVASSKAIILFALELVVLLVAWLFSKLMNKKIVKRTCILTSLTIFGFYITNYANTFVTFINNVSTRLIELIYFPTTLEFMVVMLISFGIMFYSIANKNLKKGIKFINSLLPISISFLFLMIIEYINNYNIAFDEFSVFTNPVLMSLNELAMGLFIAWVLGLIVYMIDKLIIKHITLKEQSMIELPALAVKEEIEMPRLKSEIKDISEVI